MRNEGRRRSWLALMAGGWWLITFISSASAKVFLTTDQALKLAFPDAHIQRRTIFLNDLQIKEIEKKSYVRPDSRITIYYEAKTKNKTIGYAFFDTHVVRTMPETAMIVVNPDGTVRQTEILAFFEPPDYQPNDRWLKTFRGKKLDDSLWVKRGIDAISGATTTSWALTGAVRKTLAIFQVAIAGAKP